MVPSYQSVWQVVLHVCVYCSLAGGLAWVGVLTFGVLSEQIKTRIEQADEAKSTQVTADLALSLALTHIVSYHRSNIQQLTQVVSGSKELTLPSGVSYKDVKIGGGSPVQKGYLMILDFKYSPCISFQRLKSSSQRIALPCAAESACTDIQVCVGAAAMHHPA